VYTLGKEESYFHGSNKIESNVINPETKSISVSPSKDIASAFGKNIYEVGVSKNARIIDVKNIPPEITKIHSKNPNEYDNAVREFAVKNKIDIIKGDP